MDDPRMDPRVVLGIMLRVREQAEDYVTFSADENTQISAMLDASPAVLSMYPLPDSVFN